MVKLNSSPRVLRTLFTSLSLACMLAAPAIVLSQGERSQDQKKTASAGGTITARAAFQDRSGNAVGDAVLKQTPNGVLLKVDLRGVKAGIHGFHIHETGRCEPPAFESAGGHFAPRDRQHGFLNSRGAHAGDLPNIHVLRDGDVSFEFLLKDVTLAAGQPASLLDDDGAALVMHAGSDDYHTDPAGSSGDRLACGVIAR